MPSTSSKNIANISTNRTSQQQLESLGERCIGHLNRESETLRHFIQVCRSIRNVLGNTDEETVNALLQEQRDLESTVQQIQQDREALRQAIAEYFKQHGQASVRAPHMARNKQPSIRDLEAELSSTTTQEIERLRQDIKNSIAEIQQLSLSNTHLLQHTVDLFQRLIISITGKPATTKTYDAQGTMKSHYPTISQVTASPTLPGSIPPTPTPPANG